MFRVLKRLLRSIQSSYEKQVIFSLLLFIAIILLWTGLFYLLYNRYESRPVSMLESLLFVVETVTTTGYGELLPFSHDILWIFALVMMVSGIIMFLMLVNLFVTPVIQSRINPSPPKKLGFTCQDHVLIFGYNPIILEVIENIHCLGVDVVLVEEDRDKALAESRSLSSVAQVIYGPVDDEKTWDEANISDCRYVVICLEDWVSAQVVLGIRNKTKATIIVITTGTEADSYLRLCGADLLVNSKMLVGTLTARHALLVTKPDTLATNPVMQEVLQVTSSAIGSCRFVRIPIIPGSIAEGKPLSALHLESAYHFRVAYILQKGEVILNPPEDLIIDRRMVFFLIGPAKEFFRLVHGAFLAPDSQSAKAIIGGFGDMGTVIGNDLNRLGVSCLSIDPSPKNHPDITGDLHGILPTIVDQIRQSRFFMAVTHDDRENMFASLMVRRENPDICIFSRCSRQELIPRMYQAGADYVVFVPSIIAQAVGRMILYADAQILHTIRHTWYIVAKEVKGEKPVPLRWLVRRSGVRILALDRNGEVQLIFGDDITTKTGDCIYLLGTKDQIQQAIKKLS